MSTPSSSRRLAAEFAIAAALCGGAYYFLVDSASGKIEAVRRQIEQTQQREAAQAGIGGLTQAQIDELKRTTSERVAEMKERSAPARDEAAMFARISALAATHSVRIEQLNPSQVQIAGSGAAALPPGVSAGTPAAAGAQPPPPPPGTPGVPEAPAPVVAKDTRIGYTMTVTGAYTDLAEFIGALTDRVGYTVVKSVRISQPDLHRGDMLRAAIETEHFSLDLSAIKLAGGVSAAKQPMPMAPAAATAGPEAEGE